MGAYLPLPYVYEREGRQERAWDIYSRLLRDRIVFIGTPIDDYVANSIIAQLLFLQMEVSCMLLLVDQDLVKVLLMGMVFGLVLILVQVRQLSIKYKPQTIKIF